MAIPSAFHNNLSKELIDREIEQLKSFCKENKVLLFAEGSSTFDNALKTQLEREYEKRYDFILTLIGNLKIDEKQKEIARSQLQIAILKAKLSYLTEELEKHKVSITSSEGALLKHISYLKNIILTIDRVTKYYNLIIALHEQIAPISGEKAGNSIIRHLKKKPAKKRDQKAVYNLGLESASLVIEMKKALRSIEVNSNTESSVISFEEISELTSKMESRTRQMDTLLANLSQTDNSDNINPNNLDLPKKTKFSSLLKLGVFREKEKKPIKQPAGEAATLHVQKIDASMNELFRSFRFWFNKGRFLKSLSEIIFSINELLKAEEKDEKMAYFENIFNTYWNALPDKEKTALKRKFNSHIIPIHIIMNNITGDYAKVRLDERGKLIPTNMGHDEAAIRRANHKENLNTLCTKLNTFVKTMLHALNIKSPPAAATHSNSKGKKLQSKIENLLKVSEANFTTAGSTGVQLNFQLKVS